jgi:hypothetical protein
MIDYRFDKPDFNFVQFRSNLVARWEYKAGSELYLVWSQGNTPNVGQDFSDGGSRKSPEQNLCRISPQHPPP